MKGKLNLNIDRATNRFNALIDKILPKKIFYRMLLRGRGLEFDGYRNFAPDDDANSIDWKASARANLLLTKQYIEESDIRILFVIDVGENMIFGSQKKIKCEYCAELAAALAYVMLNDPRDQIGYVFFNDDIVKINMPAPGKKQYETFVYELSNPENYGGNSNIKIVMDKILERLDPSITLVVLMSDFIRADESCKKQLENLGMFIETIAIIIKDPLDMTLPEINKEVVIEDPETGERLVVNPKIAKRIYEINAKKQEKIMKRVFIESNIDYIKIMTNKDFGPRLALFLKRRTERRD